MNWTLATLYVMVASLVVLLVVGLNWTSEATAIGGLVFACWLAWGLLLCVVNRGHWQRGLSALWGELRRAVNL